MFYRVIAILPFTIEDEGRDFYHDCELALAKAVTINPGLLTEEKGRITLELCGHDQSPAKPCEVINQAETP